MDDYIVCELIGGGSPRVTCLLLLFNAHISTHAMYCCYCWLDLCRVSYSLLRGLGNIAQENTTADILVEDQLRSPLDMATVDWAQELHTPNSWTKHIIHCGTNLQPKLCYDTSFASYFFVASLDWETQSSHGYLLEHLESLILKLRRWMDASYSNKETNKEKSLKMNFMVFLHFTFFFFCVAGLQP